MVVLGLRLKFSSSLAYSEPKVASAHNNTSDSPPGTFPWKIVSTQMVTKYNEKYLPVHSAETSALGLHCWNLLNFFTIPHKNFLKDILGKIS